MISTRKEKQRESEEERERGKCWGGGGETDTAKLSPCIYVYLSDVRYLFFYTIHTYIGANGEITIHVIF